MIYSFATFFNGFVHSFEGYASLRFLAGLGLAGELGAAITLISESFPKDSRGLGSAFVAAVGFAGAALSSIINQKVSWRHGYQMGGLLGFALLLARFKVKNPWCSWSQSEKRRPITRSGDRFRCSLHLRFGANTLSALTRRRAHLVCGRHPFLLRP